MPQPLAQASRSSVPGWATPVLAVAVVLAAASPASGHDALVGSDPADGAVLTEAPAAVVLTFAAEQAAVGAEVAVTGADGSSWSDGAAEVSGTTVTQAVASGIPDGAYTVAWRSVAQDGHPVTGTFAFTIDAPDQAADAGQAEEPDESAAPAAGPTDDASAGPADGAGGDAVAPGGADTADDLGATQGSRDDDAWTPWYTAGAALAVALALTVLVLVRRSRRG